MANSSLLTGCIYRFALYWKLMNPLDDQTTSNGRPTATPQESDRYFFGTLDSFGKNREKLSEVSWGYDQPEGDRTGVSGRGDQLGSEELGVADDLRVWRAARSR